MDEKKFYEGPDAVVTSSRFVVGDQTYAMASVSSVKIGTKDVTSSRLPSFLMMAISGLFLVGAVFGTDRSVGGIIAWLLVFGLGLLWWRAIKQTIEYTIVLATNAGERQALTSRNKLQSETIRQALVDAIIHRG